MTSKRYAVARLDEIPRVKDTSAFDVTPVRIHFGITSFGVNAYTAAKAGDRVIEEHDELGAGAGRHEELYYVALGHARFEVAGNDVDAPVGTLVFVGDPATTRGAFAQEDGTTVIVVGGVVGKPFEASPWESWLAAVPTLEAGEPERGVAIFMDALQRHPGNPNVLYNLACFESLAGRRDEALRHLEEALGADPRMREWAREDPDFDAIRDDPAFPG